MDPLRANEFFIQARKGWEKGASFFFFFFKQSQWIERRNAWKIITFGGDWKNESTRLVYLKNKGNISEMLDGNVFNSKNSSISLCHTKEMFNRNNRQL